MYSLFIDTHDFNIVLCLYKDGKMMDTNIKYSERNHSDFVMPMLDELLKRNGLSVHDLKEILAVNGPGSFTGVRLGITIAKTLAYTLNISIKLISSLEVFCISDTSTNTKKIVRINDLKGAYIGIFENNKPIDEFKYYGTSDLNVFLNENDNNLTVINNRKYDFNKIYEYMMNIESINPHKANPIYIKVIEALKW